MKERLDVLLVKRNLAESREKAKAIIMSGNVFVEDQREDKAGTTFPEDVKIEVRGHVMPYVSRGGLKLEKAIKNFDVSVEGKVCTDVGSSTGGFTDCMLQNGAVKVFAIDVGRGQLDWKLRQDPRVVCMEKTNIRYVTPEDIGEPVDFSSIDVSFISLTKVLEPIRDYLTEDGEIVALIKPQFEAGREKVGKKGVVREKSTHHEVIEKVTSYAASIGFDILEIEFSPIKGPEGNIEYLIFIQKEEQPEAYESEQAAEAALENAGIGADELDLIIVATVSADTYVPSTSCSVQGAIGAIRATCFDINAACSGFLFALNTAYAYIEMGMAKTVLVAGAETLSREVDWSDRGSCILFGDGSGAAIVQKDDSNVGGLIASVTGSDGTQGDVLTCKGRGIQNPFHNSKRKKDYIRMDGQAVFRFAVTMVPRCVKQILKKTETDVDDIKFFVLHQANVRILELIAKRLKVDIDKFPMNLDRYGNTSSASIPILLDELNRNHLLERGDKIILSGFGGGLTWGAMLIEW